LRAAVDRLPLGTRQNMLKGLETNNIIVGADGNVRGGRCPMMAASVGSSKVTGKPFARAWDAYAGVRLSRPASRHELQTLRCMLEDSIEAETGAEVDLAEAISNFSVADRPAVVARLAVAATPAVAGRPAVADTPPPVPPPFMRSDAIDDEPVDLRAAIEAHMASKERTEAQERAKSRLPKLRRAEQPDTGERDRTQELEGRHGWAWLRPFRRLDEFERAVQHLEEAERAGLAAYKRGDTREPRPRARDKQPTGTPSGGY
jgi:hypothetical protein